MKALKRLFATGVLCLAFTLGGMVADQQAHPSVLYRNLSPFVWLFQGAPVEAAYIPAAIKSIQSTSVTLTSGATTKAITSVNTSYAWLLLEGRVGGNNADVGGCQPGIRLVLTSATVVTGTRSASCGNGSDTVYFTVIEGLSSTIKSVQARLVTGIVNNTSGTTDSITSVNTSKAVIFPAGWDVTNYGVGGTGCCNGNTFQTNYVLTNSTTVTLTKPVGAASDAISESGYTVVEYR